MLLFLEDKNITHNTRSFNLAMQSGAFLQLILTLTANVSRMGSITSELNDVVHIILNVMENISLQVGPSFLVDEACTINIIDDAGQKSLLNAIEESSPPKKAIVEPILESTSAFSNKQVSVYANIFIL